jgi:hypothetical protein
MWTAKNSGRCDRNKRRYPSDLTDDEWSHVEAFGANGSPGEVKAALALHAQRMGIHRIPREAGLGVGTVLRLVDPDGAARP